MSLRDVLQIQNDRNRRRKQVLDSVYSKVKIRINHYAAYGQTQCDYDIPQIIYGLPNVDMVERGDYLQEKLIEEGFVVKRLSDSYMVVSWEKSLVAAQADQQRKLKKMKDRQRIIKKIEEDRRDDMLKSFMKSE